MPQNKKISPFHIQNPFIPKNVIPILNLLIEGREYSSNVVFDELKMQDVDIEERYIRKCLNWLERLNLVIKLGGNIYSITNLGLVLRGNALFHRDVFFDIMHYLLFTSWLCSGEEENWSWTYSEICVNLWKNRPSVKSRREIFGEISSLAQYSFPNLRRVIGTETIGVALSWIRELTPEVVKYDNNTAIEFVDRDWFSVELTMLSVSYIYIALDLSFSTPVLLNKDTLNLISPLCFSSTEQINSMIEMASRTYHELDLHVGEWGVSAILKGPVNIENL